MRRAKIHRPPGRCETLDEIGRNDHVSEAQRWEESLAERADVNHAPATIESLQGCDRHAFIAVFTIVVVLHDPGTRMVRPIEQLEAARGAHGYSQRILMRGRDVRRTRLAAQLDPGGYIHSFRVDRNRYEPAAGQREGIPHQL